MMDTLSQSAPDVLQKVHSDFGSQSEEARELLSLLVSKLGADANLRIVRSVIFISAGNIEKLKTYTLAAQTDWRDVLWWAEYHTISGEKSEKRIRDFTKPFGEEAL